MSLGELVHVQDEPVVECLVVFRRGIGEVEVAI